MPAPQRIVELVERFHRNLDAYRAGQYNETQVRREFIDPFLKALGWDVDNEKGYAEAYKEVVHEDSIRVGQGVKAPDYSCRIGGQRKFFVEAKKPSVNIKEDIHPAYQLRRYAWSAKLPLSILTDFEEFAVYDCRIKPEKSDKASQARILYLRYTDYQDKWDEIEGIFAPEAIRKGSFDRYAQEKKGQRGTAEVDSAFLQEISTWREELAQNIALRNRDKDFRSRHLSFAVQSTIDRLIFLRIAEDRGIEPYGKLRDLAEGKEVYTALGNTFRLADAKYNSGLFHFREEKGRDNDSLDTFTLGLSIDDKVLKGIIRRLYYPDSPYQFDMIPADILGQVYEQFLGKVIRMTVKRQAKIEDKPEVKKAGGVYYTPTYIVDYIVRQTVGEWLEDKTPGLNGTARHLAVLDPACGSGSFLIGAYQYLLDWYLSQYSQEPEKWLKGRHSTIFDSGKGGLRLTIGERKRILLAHIYGVDIDQQAVEVTKLSLLLKVLEGENEQTLTPQMRLLPERVLPDLSRNIKCGNSLIGPDYYDGVQQLTLGLVDEEELYRVNAFDWPTAFPTIMQAGGFEVVIGNPPYVRQEQLTPLKAYFQKQYQTAHGTADLFVYFIEKGMLLLKTGGFLSYIVANKWMRANYGKPLRLWLQKQHIVEIVDFGDLPVFKQATTYPCIFVLAKEQQTSSFSAVEMQTLQFDDLREYVKSHQYTIDQTRLDDSGWSLAQIEKQSLLDKLNKTGISLKKYVQGNLYYGIKTGLNEAFVIDEPTYRKLLGDDPKTQELLKPFVAGRDVKRYTSLPQGRFLILIPKGWTNERKGSGDAWQWFQVNYPAIADHLKPFSYQAGNRYDKGDYWWELRTCEYYDVFDNPKIVFPAITKNGSYTLDTQSFYSNDKTSVIASDDSYLLGLLNSKLLDFVLHSLASTKQGGYFEYKPMYVQQLPMFVVNPNDSQSKHLQDQIVVRVQKIIELQKLVLETQTSHEKTLLQRQIEATDRQIDQLVYQLYGLTLEEIALVEGQTR